MARRPGPRQPPLDFRRPSAADRIEAAPDPGAGAWRWSTALPVFMRVVAALWLVKGLGAWAVILGVWSPAGPFMSGGTSYQATTIFFSAVDLVAAVGLWMAGAWGGVLWLLAVTSHLVLASFFPNFVPGSTPASVFFAALVVAYLVLSRMAAREA